MSDRSEPDGSRANTKSLLIITRPWAQAKLARMAIQRRFSELRPVLRHRGPRSSGLRPESYPLRTMLYAELIHYDDIRNKVFARLDYRRDFEVEHDVSC